MGKGDYVTNLSDNVKYIQRVFAIEGHKYNFYIFPVSFRSSANILLSETLFTEL